MKWYKHDPDAFAAGTAGLTLAETGAYILLIDALYSRDGEMPDDDALIARMMHVQVRTWRPIKMRLIALGKVWIADGKVFTKRVEKELKTFRELVENQSKRARKRWEQEKNIKENNHQAMPLPAMPIQPEPEPEKKEESAKALSPARRKPRTQLPSDWKPELEFGEQGDFDKFADHARANGRLCADWPAAWRNWKRRTPEFAPRNGSWKDERQEENYRVSKQLREYVRSSSHDAGEGGRTSDAPPWKLPLPKPS